MGSIELLGFLPYIYNSITGTSSDNVTHTKAALEKDNVIDNAVDIACDTIEAITEVVELFDFNGGISRSHSKGKLVNTRV
ncbi:hypothetical protein [Vibrio owensii]|uniref:hypothetical protein n=1 Tax=Vibrio harveyi group TaxID=717610 RepID=UPI003CC57334